MHLGVDVMCMYTNFCGHGLSSFGDKISKIFNLLESAQKINACRDWID